MSNEIIGLDGLAKYLGIPENEARFLSAESKLKPVETRAMDEFGFLQRPIYETSAADKSLEHHVREYGLSEAQAALELGLTRESFSSIKSKIRYGIDNKFLKQFLDAFRDRFLPTHKTWNTRSSLLREFVENYNRKHSPKLTLQLCEMEKCGHVASDQCVNPACREGQSPRFLCPAHAMCWIDTDRDIRLRPEVICPICEDKVEQGLLNYRPMGAHQHA